MLIYLLIYLIVNAFKSEWSVPKLCNVYNTYGRKAISNALRLSFHYEFVCYCFVVVFVCFLTRPATQCNIANDIKEKSTNKKEILYVCMHLTTGASTNNNLLLCNIKINNFSSSSFNKNIHNHILFKKIFQFFSVRFVFFGSFTFFCFLLICFSFIYLSLFLWISGWMVGGSLCGHNFVSFHSNSFSFHFPKILIFMLFLMFYCVHSHTIECFTLLSCSNKYHQIGSIYI